MKESKLLTFQAAGGILRGGIAHTASGRCCDGMLMVAVRCHTSFKRLQLYVLRTLCTVPRSRIRTIWIVCDSARIASGPESDSDNSLAVFHIV